MLYIHWGGVISSFDHLYFIFTEQSQGNLLGTEFMVFFPIICSTYLTSIWLWLYLIAGACLRILYIVENFRAFIDKVLKLDQHPLRVMALILVAVYTAIYWPVVLFL